MDLELSMGNEENGPLLSVLNTILGEVSHLRLKADEVSDLRKELVNHVRDEEKFQKALLKNFASAFPEGDPTLHRIEHEERIARAKFCKSFWEARAQQLGSGGMWAFISVVGALIVYYWNGHVPGSMQVPLGN